MIILITLFWVETILSKFFLICLINPEIGVKLLDGNRSKDGGSNYKAKYGKMSYSDYKKLNVSVFSNRNRMIIICLKMIVN